MSRNRLAVIVEGRVLDRSFYDRILKRNNDARRLGYEIYLSEEIMQSNGVTAGGKAAVLALHDYFRRTRKLSQKTNLGDKVILCMVDRDYDHLKGSKKRSNHIVYTNHADVEADIFHNCTIDGALSTALSITEDEASSLATQLGDYMSRLAVLWRDWIELCCVAIAVDARCSVRPSRRSGVNVPEFGPADPTLVAKAHATISTSTPIANFSARKSRIQARVSNAYSRGQEGSLVKGKWVPHFLEHEVRAATRGRTVDLSGFVTTISKNCLDAVDFDDNWTQHYHQSISTLIAHR